MSKNADYSDSFPTISALMSTCIRDQRFKKSSAVALKVSVILALSRQKMHLRRRRNDVYNRKQTVSKEGVCKVLMKAVLSHSLKWFYQITTRSHQACYRCSLRNKASKQSSLNTQHKKNHQSTTLSDNNKFWLKNKHNHEAVTSSKHHHQQQRLWKTLGKRRKRDHSKPDT